MRFLRPARARHRARRGFSLIEIVVAMVLLTIIATGLGLYISYQARARNTGKQTQLAFVAAQALIDSVRTLPFDQITTGTKTVTSSIADIQLKISTSITLKQPKLKLVDINVKTMGGRMLQHFVTAVFKPI